MDTKAHFQSLAAEITALKDRVQNLIAQKHWPTVGAWKETVLRSVIRRHLPASLHIGSGFVISESGLSTQIDILIYDDSGPILFRDGDLVIVTPDVVRAAIEVKTRISKQDLPEVLTKIDTLARLLHKTPGHPSPFFGLFSYEEHPFDPEYLLGTLKETNGGIGNYEINCISIGLRQFVRFWPFHPRGETKRAYDHWHCYELENIGQAYFVHNVIDHLFPDQVRSNNNLWYPIDGKENSQVGGIAKV